MSSSDEFESDSLESETETMSESESSDSSIEVKKKKKKTPASSFNKKFATEYVRFSTRNNQQVSYFDSDDDEDEEEEIEAPKPKKEGNPVDAVMDHKYQEGRLVLLIKWKGKSNLHNTWTDRFNTSNKKCMNYIQAIPFNNDEDIRYFL